MNQYPFYAYAAMNNPDFHLQQIFQEGFAAYQKGRPEKDNPHRRLSEQFFAWLRGWNTARFGEGMNR